MPRSVSTFAAVFNASVAALIWVPAGLLYHIAHGPRSPLSAVAAAFLAVRVVLLVSAPFHDAGRARLLAFGACVVSVLATVNLGFAELWPEIALGDLVVSPPAADLVSLLATRAGVMGILALFLLAIPLFQLWRFERLCAPATPRLSRPHRRWLLRFALVPTAVLVTTFFGARSINAEVAPSVGEFARIAAALRAELGKACGSSPECRYTLPPAVVSALVESRSSRIAATGFWGCELTQYRRQPGQATEYRRFTGVDCDGPFDRHRSYGGPSRTFDRSLPHVELMATYSAIGGDGDFLYWDSRTPSIIYRDGSPLHLR